MSEPEPMPASTLLVMVHDARFMEARIAALTGLPLASTAEAARKPFPFFGLPLELRQQIYSELVTSDSVIDLDSPMRRALNLLLVSKQWHCELMEVLFSTNTFRLLPTCPKAVARRAKPLLAHLKRNKKELIRHVELRLGPYWTQPPKCWKIDKRLGLEDLVNVRRLKIFVQIDPSHPIFRGYRGSKADGFYTAYCSNLLKDVLKRTATVEEVEIDAEMSVSRTGDLVAGLASTVTDMGKKLVWGSAMRSDHDDFIEIGDLVLPWETSFVYLPQPASVQVESTA